MITSEELGSSVADINALINNVRYNIMPFWLNVKTQPIAGFIIPILLKT
jgi:hypothetical protein